MSEEKIIIKQSTPVYGTLGIIFGFIGIFILSPLFSPSSVDTWFFGMSSKGIHSWHPKYRIRNFRNHHLAHSDGTT